MLAFLKPVSLKKDRNIRIERLESMAEAVQILDLPRDAHVMHLARLDRDLVMAIEVRPDQEFTKHAFVLYKPGQWVAAGGAYLCSFLEDKTDLSNSWHLYRVPVPPLISEGPTDEQAR